MTRLKRKENRPCEACGVRETAFYAWIRRGENGERPASSSRKAVSFSSARTTKRFPSPRCASAIQIVRPLESIAETQRKAKQAFVKNLPSGYVFDGVSGNDRCHLTAGRFDDHFTQNLIGDDALDRTRELIADAVFHTVAFLRGSKHGLKTDAGHRDERLIRAGYCTAATVGWPSWR